MNAALAQIHARIGRRGIAAAGVVLVALFASVATPQLLGHRVAAALSTLSTADAKWLWIAGVGFLVSVVAPRPPGAARSASAAARRPHRGLRPLRRRLARQHIRAFPRRRRRPDRPLRPRPPEPRAPPDQRRRLRRPRRRPRRRARRPHRRRSRRRLRAALAASRRRRARRRRDRCRARRPPDALPPLRRLSRAWPGPHRPLSG